MSMEYPCIYFEKDGKCRKFSDNTAISYCVMGPCPEQTLSNADRIRAMTDEELSDIFLRADFCKYCEHEKTEYAITSVLIQTFRFMTGANRQH